MIDLEGRVIAIAGAAGGLGPAVARRLADAGATLALTDVDTGRLDALVDDLALPDDRFDARVADLLGDDGAREWAKRSRSASAAPTACFTWSAAGVAASRSPRRRSPTTSGCTTCSCAPSSTPPAPSTRPCARAPTAASCSSPPRRPRAPSGTNAAYGAAKAAAESWTLALADQFRADESAATANILVVNAILTPQMREENPDKPFSTFTSAEDIADAIAFICSDSAAKMNGKRLSLHP